MHQLLSSLDYKKYKWHIFGHLKLIELLLGTQPGYTKFCCFYENGTVATEPATLFVKSGLKGAIFFLDLKKISHKPLVKTNYVYLPPLHIKMRLMKIFMKILSKEGEAIIN